METKVMTKNRTQNRLKVMRCLTSIYTSLKIYCKKVSIKIFMCAPTKKQKLLN